MRPTCPQLPAGAAPRQVLLSFLQRAPRTAGEVKDSWAPAHSQGRSCGLDSFLPIPTSPGVLGLQRTLRLYLVVAFLCLLGKHPDPLERKQLSLKLQDREASSWCRLCSGLREASTAKQTQEWRLSCALSARMQGPCQRPRRGARNSHLRALARSLSAQVRLVALVHLVDLTLLRTPPLLSFKFCIGS
ncbi:hypothetical protein mRhiFer1_008154 [Rhinolophus ferrumequinum]|uniref:Uncharacterized protein n=1 Tax=Rhinolophus ferrumequinum TaxID=59479 RepID=A0A7J7W7I6_RHIFE|nr:hypothetical protein mRhiFer1_008154 [Rhinolophus ferrumequinum]